MRIQIATNQSELARACGVSPSTISRYVELGLIPVGKVRLGRRSLYSPDQVEGITKFFTERKRGEPFGKYKYEGFEGGKTV